MATWLPETVCEVKDAQAGGTNRGQSHARVTTIDRVAWEVDSS